MNMKTRQSNSGLVTSLGRASLIFSLATAGAANSLAGCASEPSSDGSEDGEQVGSLDLNLDVAPGVTINTVNYSITGNGFTKSGTINVSGAPTISANIGGIPAGTGYSITLTASSTQGNASFTGSASFDVSAGGIASVKVSLRGSVGSGNGSVNVTGTINVSPVIDELTVSPLTVYVGSSVALTSVSRDPDQFPAPLTYYWSTTGGLIDTPIAQNATLTSTTAGTFTVTLTVSDGDATTTATRSVTFVNPEQDSDGGVVGTGPSKPNVLLIIADDYGAEASSLYPQLAGTQGQVSVPNIEALAANGLVFDNAWASPVCSPTRGTIISGQYGYRTGVTTVGDVLPTSTVTLFDRLTAESPSYEQAFFGKYHVGGGSINPRAGVAYPGVPQILQHARDIGITNFRGILGGAIVDYFNWVLYDINGPSVPETTYATTVLTDLAIDYIHQHETNKPNEPWFLYQAFNAPHAANGGNNPYQLPPSNLHHVDLSSVGNPAPGAYQTTIPAYQADIQALDTELGRLLAEVDLETTTVIFIGDNGVPPPVKDVQTGLRDSKGSAYEGGVRVPLIVAGAGVTRRGREDDLFVTTDLYASILELTGVSVPQVNNSYSFKPLLSDEAASNGRTHSFSETSSGTNNRRYAIKDKRYKLLNNLGKWELYDLVTDPKETTNLYTSKPHTAVLASLQAEIAKLKADARPGYFQ
ncbi:MAG: sulfatase-like hydrolase/transferase [Myxococcales bacterium]